MSDFFGKSKDGGGNYVKKNWWKLKDGEAVYRILPALGGNAESGTWSVFWNVHYGYKNSKGELRTFQSPEVKNNKTKMIEAPDAAKTRIEKLKAQFEEAKKVGNKELIAKLDKLVGQKGQFNIDSNHYMNVIDQAGNIGILKIRHRAMVALRAEIKRLEAEGVDPRDPTNGRFLVFRRSGSGLDTTFNVTVLQETVDVPNFGMMKRDKVSVLPADTAARCAKQVNGKWVYLEAGDLPNLYKRPTSEQVERIVKEGAVAVDEILDTKSGSATDSGPAHDEGHDDDYVDTPAPTQTAAPAAIPAQVTPAATAQAPAPAEAPKAAAPAPAPAVATASEEQSNLEFLKSLGL